MLSDVKEAFNDMVAELDWMDAGTRARAHRKLAAIRPFVGFPDWITNTEKLNKFYDGVSEPCDTQTRVLFRTFHFYRKTTDQLLNQCHLFQAEVVDGRLLDTLLKFTNIGVQKSLNSLREKPDKNRWISSGTTVNAFYSAVLNSVSKSQSRILLKESY